MPRKPIDYTKFYKLCWKDIKIADVYVGHTTEFRKRKNKHKNNCCNEHNREYSYHVYQFIRANGGWDNWDMVLDALEARRREREHVEQLHATLNRVVPNRSRKEYYDDHADIIRERARERERASIMHRMRWGNANERIVGNIVKIIMWKRTRHEHH